MATRVSSASPSSTTAGLRQKVLSRVVETPPPAWVRNPSWPPCDASIGDQKMVFLNAIFDGRIPTASNFLAFRVLGGDFTVDFGDGTVTNFANGTTVEYQYSFTSTALVGTDAPVTINATTDTIDRTAHGYTDGMSVYLYNVVSTPQVPSGSLFYVVNAAADSFQISLTPGGSPVLFTADGTATLLPYRIATVTITPQPGQSITSIDMDRRHSAVFNTYATNILDVCVAFSTLTSIIMFSNGFVLHRNIERFRLLQMSAVGTVSFTNLCRDMSQLQSVTIGPTNADSISSMFRNCTNLVYAPEMSLASVGTATQAFSTCRALYSVPSYTMPSCSNFISMFELCARLREVGRLTGSTSIPTNFSSMFNNALSLVNAPPIDARFSVADTMFNACASLVNVPAYNTSLAINFSSMFSACESLDTVPLFDTASAQFMGSMFSGCRSLTSVPLFNTQNVTNMASMFTGCSALQTVPLFNTQNVTSMPSMFFGCASLRSVPFFNTQSVTSMNSMFSNCRALTSVPLFNTQNVTNMGNMFSGCSSLESVPRFNTSRNVNMGSMFFSCISLKSVPQFDTSLCTAVFNMFQSCTALTDVPSFNFTAATSFNNMFNGCNSLVVFPGFTAGTTALTNTASMFQNCSALSQVGPINLNGVGSGVAFNAMFSSCPSLTRMRGFNMRFSFSVASGVLSKGALEEIFENVATAATTQIVTVSGNFGVGSAITSTCTSVAGSAVVTTSNTTNVVAGMLATGTQTALTTTVTATADPATDTFTRVAHGLPNGRKLSLSTLGTVTGLSIFRLYYVVNATADTFQIADTVGGAPIDFGGTSSAVTLRYPAYVVSVVPGVSITLDAPQAGSGTSSLVFRALDISSANLKNWNVTT